MTSHVVHNVLFHFFNCHSNVFFKNDTSHYFFTILFIRNTDNLNVFNVFVGVNKFFNFFRVNIFTTTNNHILESACNTVVTFRCSASKVACVEPAVFVNSGSSSLRHFIIAFHYVVATCNKFACNFVRTIFAGFRVNNFTFNFR